MSQESPNQGRPCVPMACRDMWPAWAIVAALVAATGARLLPGFLMKGGIAVRE
jgi:hypothetical protein